MAKIVSACSLGHFFNEGQLVVGCLNKALPHIKVVCKDIFSGMLNFVELGILSFYSPVDIDEDDLLGQVRSGPR